MIIHIEHGCNAAKEYIAPLKIRCTYVIQSYATQPAAKSESVCSDEPGHEILQLEAVDRSVSSRELRSAVNEGVSDEDCGFQCRGITGFVKLLVEILKSELVHCVRLENRYIRDLHGVLSVDGIIAACRQCKLTYAGIYQVKAHVGVAPGKGVVLTELVVQAGINVQECSRRYYSLSESDWRERRVEDCCVDNRVILYVPAKEAEGKGSALAYNGSVQVGAVEHKVIWGVIGHEGVLSIECTIVVKETRLTMELVLAGLVKISIRPNPIRSCSAANGF